MSVQWPFQGETAMFAKASACKSDGSVNGATAPNSGQRASGMAPALRALAAVGAVALALTIGAGDARAQVCAEGGGGADSLKCPGDNATANGDNSTAVGQEATTGTNANATAVGFQAVAADRSTATGAFAEATVSRSTATGFEADAKAPDATATGFQAEATDEASTATGAGADAKGLQSTATGSEAMALGFDSTATGVVAEATKDFSTATGAFSDAKGEESTATGYLANASADQSTALGATAQATFVGATAIGFGATTTRANQIVLGRVTETYTLPGLTSAASKAAQSGPLELVTTDAAGNLASDGGETFRRIDENQEGVAVAIALSDPDLFGGQKFAIKANGGFFEGWGAFGVTAKGLLKENVFGGGEMLTVSGGFGYGVQEQTVGGRVSIQLGW